MGMNTAMIVRNDFLHEIESDPEFGRKVADAIRYSSHPEHAPYHGQGFDVLPSQHADHVQIVALTGNTIRLLGYGGSWTATDEEAVRYVAEGMGYRLVKKGGR